MLRIPWLKSIGSVFLSALFMVLAHPPYHIWLLAWVALVPFFFVIEGQSIRRAFWLGYVFGLFYCFGMFWWFVHVTLPGMILFNMFLAVYFALFAATSVVLARRPLIWRCLLVACAWVAWEFARANLLSGFGWAAFGHTQYQHIPMIQIADMTGVFGISFLLVWVNYVVYFCIKQYWDRTAHLWEILSAVVSTVLLLGAVCGYGVWRTGIAIPNAKNQVTIALIQPNIRQRDKWDPMMRDNILMQLDILSREAAKEKPDVIVWPESALPAAPFGLEGDLDQAKALADEIDIPLVLGYVRSTRGTFYNTAGLISADGHLRREYDKLHLVPFGEFIPLRGLFPFLSNFIPIDDISPGKDPVVFSLKESPGALAFSVLICFEDTVDAVARRMVRSGAEALFNMTNDAWFHDTKAPWLHLQAAVFQAVAYKRPLVRSANTGVSAVISPYGEIQKIMTAYDGRAVFRSGFLVADISPRADVTVRLRFGDMFAYLCIACLLVGVIINNINIIFRRKTA